MLLYNVSYLAHTQSVDVPLSQAGDVLSNLWMVCCSAELGRYAIYISITRKTLLTQMSTSVRKSHETHPTLPPPTPASFALDFAQLLQATTANPASRPRAKRLTHHTASGVARERIEESAREDEDWDLVDDDV